MRCNGFITAAHERKGKSYSNSSVFHTGAKRVRGLRVRSVGEVGVAPAPGFSRDCLSLGSLPARATWLREPRLSGEAGYLICFSTGSLGALHLLNWQRPGCHNTQFTEHTHTNTRNTHRTRTHKCKQTQTHTQGAHTSTER